MDSAQLSRVLLDLLGGVLPEILVLVGTLAGAVVGAGVTAWVHKRQLEHEDRTRFHATRLETYAEFLVAANSANTFARLGTRNAHEEMQVLATHEKARLVCSEAVLPILDEVFSAHDAVIDASTSEDLDLQAHSDAFNQAVADFLNAARRELGHRG